MKWCLCGGHGLCPCCGRGLCDVWSRWFYFPVKCGDSKILESSQCSVPQAPGNRGNWLQFGTEQSVGAPRFDVLAPLCGDVSEHRRPHVVMCQSIGAPRFGVSERWCPRVVTCQSIGAPRWWVCFSFLGFLCARFFSINKVYSVKYSIVFNQSLTVQQESQRPIRWQQLRPDWSVLVFKSQPSSQTASSSSSVPLLSPNLGLNQV